VPGGHQEQHSSELGAAAPVDRELVLEVSRELVASLAPEEMPLFRPVSTAFFADPRRLSSESRDDMLGFGPGEAVTLITPVVISVVVEVIGLVRSELARDASRQVAQGVEDVVRRLFRKPGEGHAPQPAAPELTREQLARVRSVAFEKARQGGLGERRAQLLADATVGSLVLSP
jgi:hypothetical protein